MRKLTVSQDATASMRLPWSVIWQNNQGHLTHVAGIIGAIGNKQFRHTQVPPFCTPDSYGAVLILGRLHPPQNSLNRTCHHGCHSHCRHCRAALQPAMIFANLPVLAISLFAFSPRSDSLTTSICETLKGDKRTVGRTLSRSSTTRKTRHLWP